jgi:hypothetical protein
LGKEIGRGIKTELGYILQDPVLNHVGRIYKKIKRSVMIFKGEYFCKFETGETH